ncbi:MAG: PAS domain S-box protein [Dehalococcoidia bacterium]|nr:PAS domain S-box protein [Dehalococcoidia bacterium]
MAAMLDAASQHNNVEDYLCRTVALLSKYARCSCIGVAFLTEDGIMSCTLRHGSTTEFARSPKGTFPASEKCICSGIMRHQATPHTEPARDKAFFRNSKPVTPGVTDTGERPFGLCVGSTFESVAIVPIGNPWTAAGFLFIGDERRNRISPGRLALVEQVVSHIATTVDLLAAKDRLNRLSRSLPDFDAKPESTARHLDELELLTQLMENSNESIVIVQDWRIVYVNKKTAELAGLSKEEMIGQAFLDIVHPEDRGMVRERYSRILNGEWFTSGLTARGLDRDGNTRWAEMREIPFTWHGRPAVMSLVNDITERKRAEDALRESEQKYRALADRSLQGIVIALGTPPRIAYCNAAMAELTGFTVEELLSMTPEQIVGLIHPEDRDMFFRRYANRIKGLPAESRYQFRAVRRDGAVIWLEIFATAIEYAGEPAVQAAFIDITERKMAEEALAESERKYRQLVETVDEGIGAIDKEATIVFVNRRMAEIFGYAADEMIGKPLFSFLAHTADGTGMEEAPRKIERRRQGVSEAYEARAFRKDGTEIHLSVRSSPILDDQGNYAGVIAAVQDITEQKQAEEALRESERLYRFLADNTSDVIWVTDMDLRPTYLSPSITSLTGYSVEEAMSGALETRLTPASVKAASEAFADALNREKQQPGATGSRRIELELLRKDGSTLWVDTTVSFIRDSQGRAIGILGAMRDVTERRKAEEALKKSEAKYRDLFDHTLLGMEVVDGQTGTTLLANRSLARMFGFKSPEDMVGTKPLDYVLPEDLEWVVSQISALMADPTWAKTAQIRARTEDGRIIWVTGMGAPIEYEGRPAMLLSLVDITEVKEAEARLHESEERYRLLVENANEGIAVLQDGLLKFTNPRFAEATGYTVEELLSMPFIDLIHPDDRQMAGDYYFRRLKGQEVPPLYQCRFVDKAGNTKWTEVNAVLFEWEARTATLALLQDITERKRADDALKESEEKFRALAENSSDLIVLLDRNAVISYESPAASRLLGLDPAARVGERPFERVHPDDLPAVTEAFNELMRNPSAGPRRISEMRLQHRDGSWRTMEATGSAVVRGGEVTGIVVTLHDITERKQAEEALRASEERFRALIEKATDAIAVVDSNGRLLYESRSMEQITGYRLDDWLGKPMSDWLLHPDDVAKVASSLQRLLTSPEPASEGIRVRFKHRDGSWHFLEGTARNLLNDPSVRGIVVNYRDVTERVLAEEALRASELRYRLLAENISDVIFTADLDMKLTYVSPSILQLTGYSAEETMSRSPDDWLTPASKDLAVRLFTKSFLDAKAGKDLPPALRTATLEMPTKDGGTIWAEIKIDFLRDVSGELTGILGVARDITDRRIAEMELEHRSKLETLITEISTAFVGISTDYMDQGIQNALGSISAFTGVDCSHIFVLSEDGSRLDLAYEWRSKEIDPSAGRLGSATVSGLPWLSSKVKETEYVYIPEVKDMPSAADAERALFEQAGIRSVVVVPMVQSGISIGCLCLSSTSRGQTWGEETIGLLRLVAQMFSNAMERKRMDLALRESERRYRLLAENVTDVIWTTDMEANITYMSPSATRLVGFSPEELSRMTVADLLTPDSYERGMRLLAEKQANATQDAPAGNWTLEVELRRKDGSTVWAEETVSFLRDEHGTPIGLTGVTRDISSRKKMEDALRLSEDKYRTLVEASPDGVLSIDRRGIIADCNAGLCRMLGYERRQLCGMEARLLGTKKDLDAEPYYRENLLRGEPTEVETEILRHDGQPLPVWAKLVRLAEPSTADIQTIIYLRDITDRRKIDEMKDEFVGLVSHELRSPLTVIIGALHTAISEGPRLSQKETRQLLEDAAFEAEQLSHLVGNLLELSRAQANRLFLHVEAVNLPKVIHKVIEAVQRQSPKHKFIVDLPRKLPQVSADQLRLERVLYNLLENSVKYSPEGSEITVSAKRDAGQLVISVTDQGPGISKEDQAKLFQRFQQLGDPMLNHTKGAGLGLLVCRRLVEAHGGRIWVESEPGHGASFRFTLEPGARDKATPE